MAQSHHNHSEVHLMNKQSTLKHKAGKAKDLERYVVVAINSENKGWQRTLRSWS